MLLVTQSVACNWCVPLSQGVHLKMEPAGRYIATDGAACSAVILTRVKRLCV